MRILVGHSRYQSGPVSGENRVVDDEVELLRRGGHDVLLWDPEAATSSGFGLAKTAQQAVWATESVDHLRRAMREHKPDVVHFHNLFPALSPAVLRAASSAGVPTVMTLHNYRLLCLPATFLRDGKVCEDCLGHLPWRGIVHRCFRDSLAGSAAYAASLSLHRRIKSFERVALYLCVSRFVSDKHVEAGWPRERLEVKPNFTWPSPRRQGPGEYFLFLGRLSSEKGAEVIVDTWRPELGRLVIAGDGPEMSLLKAKARTGVEFLGAVPPERATTLLSGARAVLVPSVCYEGAPRTIAEAYGAGVPVIASRIGALTEAVEAGVTGLLANPGDTADWAQAISRLRNDEESVRLGEGGYGLWSKRNSPESSLALLEAAYNRVSSLG